MQSPRRCSHSALPHPLVAFSLNSKSPPLCRALRRVCNDKHENNFRKSMQRIFCLQQKQTIGKKQGHTEPAAQPAWQGWLSRAAPHSQSSASLALGVSPATTTLPVQLSTAAQRDSHNRPAGHSHGTLKPADAGLSPVRSQFKANTELHKPPSGQTYREAGQRARCQGPSAAASACGSGRSSSGQLLSWWRCLLPACKTPGT